MGTDRPRNWSVFGRPGGADIWPRPPAADRPPTDRRPPARQTRLTIDGRVSAPTAAAKANPPQQTAHDPVVNKIDLTGPRIGRWGGGGGAVMQWKDETSDVLSASFPFANHGTSEPTYRCPTQKNGPSAHRCSFHSHLFVFDIDVGVVHF